MLALLAGQLGHFGEHLSRQVRAALVEVDVRAGEDSGGAGKEVLVVGPTGLGLLLCEGKKG